MANNKVYSNYLMHGRTKGSRNGISTTKGYRAVGHKARGRLGPDGRYIYDMSTHKKYVANGLGSAGMGSYRSYELNTKNAKKNGIDVNFARKTVNSLNKGADNPWQQKANAAQYKDLYKDAVRSDTSRNTWQQNARASEFRTRNVDVYDPTTDTYQSMDRNKFKDFDKALVRKLEGTLPNTLGGATNQSSVKGTVTKANIPGINTATDPRFNRLGSAKIDMAKGVAFDKKQLRELQAGVAKERAKEIHDANIAGQNMAYENSKKAANRKAAEKSKAQGAQNNWQQQASLEQWKKQNQNNIAEKKAIQKKKDLIAKADVSYAKNLASEKGAKNNWQQMAAKAAAAGERNNRVNAVVANAKKKSVTSSKSNVAKIEKAITDALKKKKKKK